VANVTVPLPSLAKRPTRARRSKGAPYLFVRVVGGLLALLLVVLAVRAGNPALAWRAVVHAGPAALVVVVPSLLALVCDVMATKISLRSLGTFAGFGDLFRARLATEAIHGSVPLGALVADATSPVLFGRIRGVGVPNAIAMLTTRKRVLVRAHGVYVLSSAVIAFFVLARVGERLVGTALLPYFVAASALVPFAASGGLAFVLRRPNVARRCYGALFAIPWEALRARLRRHEAAFLQTDAALARSFVPSNLGGRTHWKSVRALDALYLGVWLFEVVESFAVLRALGIHADLTSVLSFEAGLSIVKSTIILFPSGLGIAELGYVAIFAAYGYGGPDAALAFSLIKRAKDSVFIALGYGAMLRTSTKSDAPRPRDESGSDLAPVHRACRKGVRRIGLVDHHRVAVRLEGDP